MTVCKKNMVCEKSFHLFLLLKMISLDLLEGNMRSDIMCKHNKETVTVALSFLDHPMAQTLTPDSVDIKR